MCGIVAYIGKNQALPVLLDGLRRLEYRGYDSSGVAILGLEVFTEKAVGKIINLEEKLIGKNLVGTLGIAHTRWATHGEPNEINAHPHHDCTGKIWVVHNGIIENYQELKKELINRGHIFVSQTDTEVLAHLIESFYKGDITKALQKTLKIVKGTYGIAAFTADEPGKIVAARSGSPLVVGLGDDETVIASDVSAILRHTKQVIYLDDGEIAEINGAGFRIYNAQAEEIDKTVESIEWDLDKIEKQGFEHFMLKEIFEQPETIINSIRGRVMVEEGKVKLGGLDDVLERLRAIDKIKIVACGTAMHAGLVGKYMLEEYAGISTEVDCASEFRYRKPIIDAKTAVIVISQSGETADTLAAMRESKEKGALTLGIVNTVGSSIARETHAGVYNHIGPEIAVASTKAFLSQVSILALFTVLFGRQRAMSITMGERILKELTMLPEKIKSILEQNENIKEIVEKYGEYDHFAFLGRKYNNPVAFEGALKLKELSYIHAEGFQAGEMKHGPIALIDENFPTMFIAPRDSVYEKNISNIQEIKTRKGKVIAIATEGDEEIAKIVDDVIYIPKTLEMLTPILSVIPLQFFAYYAAVLRGNDVDKPRNLAKSVTVE